MTDVMMTLLARPSPAEAPVLPRMHGPEEVARLDVPKPSESELDRWGFPEHCSQPAWSLAPLPVGGVRISANRQAQPTIHVWRRDNAGTGCVWRVADSASTSRSSERSFGFQSNLLGGRHLPGGTVSDFVVWNGGSRVGVYVDLSSTSRRLSGLARRRSSTNGCLPKRVIARTDITVVMRINRIELGMPLETGRDELVEREFERFAECVIRRVP